MSRTDELLSEGRCPGCERLDSECDCFEVYDETETPTDETCGLCGGALFLLGSMGKMTYGRCRACGFDQMIGG